MTGGGKEVLAKLVVSRHQSEQVLVRIALHPKKLSMRKELAKQVKRTGQAIFMQLRLRLKQT